MDPNEFRQADEDMCVVARLLGKRLPGAVGEFMAATPAQRSELFRPLMALLSAYEAEYYLAPREVTCLFAALHRLKSQGLIPVA